MLTHYSLEPAHVEMMAQLNIWTRCCEFSVANSVHDCLDEDVRAIGRRLPPGAG